MRKVYIVKVLKDVIADTMSGNVLEALKAYSFKPDCFKQAANKMIVRCQDLEFEEDVRVNGMYSHCRHTFRLSHVSPRYL